MPRVKPIAAHDAEETKIRQEIWMVMGALRINIKGLADMTGINYSTLKTRLSKNGISGMRLSELWAIRDLGVKRGVIK